MNYREIAVYALIDILDEKGYNNLVLKRYFRENPNLTKNEKSLITEIVNGTIRNLIFIDYLINLFSKINTNKMKPLILNIIRISIYQIKFMPNIPDSAACNEAVELTKKKIRNLDKFVNAILRNIVRNINNINLPDKDKTPIEFLSIKYSMPKWVIKIWLDEYNFETVENICKSSLTPPKISICVNKTKTDKLNLKNILEKEGLKVREGVLSKNSLYISNINDLSRLQSFKDGLFHTMDESSMFCVEAFGVEKDKTLIDICAAPGGKSFYLSYLMENKGLIISRDIHKHKIDLIKDNLNRLSLNIIKPEVKDATVENTEDFDKADYVLIDAPCSGLGILKRKPDIKFSRTYSDVESLIMLQKQILKSCHKYVKIGGILIYSTCTINKKENLENVLWFCENFNYSLVSLSNSFDYNFKDYKIDMAKGYFQILPFMFDTDGFFVAKMVRKE